MLARFDSSRRRQGLNRVHACPCNELFILIAQSGYLQERIDAVSFQAVQIQAAGPVLCVHSAQRQAHAQAQVGRPAGQRGQGALVGGGGLEVGAAELVFHMELLHCRGHAGDLAEVLEALGRLRALGEGPQVGQLGAGDAAAAVGYAEYDVFLGLADGHLDGGRGRRGVRLPLVPVNDSLDRVAEELADNVLDVAQDVGEAGVEVADDVDLGDGGVGPVGGAGEGRDGFGAARDDVLGGTFDEDLADEVGLGELRAGREVGGVEGFGEGEVLLGDDAAGYSLETGGCE